MREPSRAPSLPGERSRDDAPSRPIPPPEGSPAAFASPLTGLRLWFIIYLAWMIGLTVIAQYYFGRYENGDQEARGPWLLAGMCFYLTLCNLFLPAPTMWIILLVASNDIALIGNPYPRIAVVALAGAAGTTMANLNEYHVLGYFFRARLGDRIRRTRAYQWAARWFNVSPFQVLVLVSFVPIPIDVVRWIAILRRYSRARFAIAYFMGRTLRYALLGSISVLLSLKWWQIVLIQVALALLLAARLLWAILRTVTHRDARQDADADVGDAAA